MQRKRNFRLLISLVLLTLATVLLLLLNSGENSSVDKSLFKVIDQAEINEVKFDSPQGKIELKFQGNKWMVNGKEADQQLVKVFFATILQAEPKRKITPLLADSLKKSLGQPTKVSLLKSGQLEKEYFVVGNAAKSETYFYFHQGEWYVVTIPGYRVFIASIFELTPNDWREKRIFNFNWQNFKTLRASFPKRPQEDFGITAQKQVIAIDGMDADTTKLLSYVDAVLQMPSDKILTTEEAKSYDSLFNTEPSVTISIFDIANREWKLSVFGDAFSPKNTVAKLNDEAVLLNPRSVAILNRGKTYFKPKK